jgi:hypothetical protein
MTESDENVQRVSGFKPVYMGSQQCKEQKAGQQTFITKNGVRPLLMFVHLLRTGNTMTKRKRTKGQTTIYKTLFRKQKIE